MRSGESLLITQSQASMCHSDICLTSIQLLQMLALQTGDSQSSRLGLHENVTERRCLLAAALRLHQEGPGGVCQQGHQTMYAPADDMRRTSSMFQTERRTGKQAGESTGPKDGTGSQQSLLYSLS